MINLDKIPRGSVVVVKWEDTVTDPRWVDQEEFCQQELALCATAGIWMRATKTVVFLAHNVGDDVCDGTRIPRANVKSIEVLKRGKRS
jgi:hypothetical protein